ncbi:MAG: hypothetical protein WC499_04280 [Patescibacteria group bacterium]
MTGLYAFGVYLFKNGGNIFSNDPAIVFTATVWGFLAAIIFIIAIMLLAFLGFLCGGGIHFAHYCITNLVRVMANKKKWVTIALVIFIIAIAWFGFQLVNQII